MASKKKKDDKALKKKTQFTIKVPKTGQRITVMAEQHGLTDDELSNNDIDYYRRKLKETEEKLWTVRNNLSSLEALYRCYLSRLLDLQGHQ
jgi:5-bromo-4-chloroindolyl phosphate hydrolysis protein